MRNRELTVVLNGLTCDWKKINSDVPHGSLLGPLLFLIYVNDLPEGITSIDKIFADDTSLFPKVSDMRDSQNALNFHLKSMSNWVYQWKLQFNPYSKKQALSFLVNRNHIRIHQSYSITILSPNVLIRSTWVSPLISNLTL